MSAFVAAALGVPTVFLTFLLIVVIGYWLVVLLGAGEIDALDGAEGEIGEAGHGTNGGLSGGLSGALATVGLGGVPVTVVLSLLIAVAWFVSLIGTVLLGHLTLSTPLLAAAGLAVLIAAGLVAVFTVRLLVLPIRRMFSGGAAPSRADFVGRPCVIRTGRVGADFGQAEVTAGDGSSAVVQVRQTGNEALTAGSVALIYDYDPDGEFFWVLPRSAATGPELPGTEPQRNS
ncbi:MAG TPA: hypothetical protein VK453_29110 [Micromonosporaceae bacterium]|nr:hypothetical protein [Micromonosporaceae bacterium]